MLAHSCIVTCSIMRKLCAKKYILTIYTFCKRIFIFQVTHTLCKLTAPFHSFFLGLNSSQSYRARFRFSLLVKVLWTLNLHMAHQEKAASESRPLKSSWYWHWNLIVYSCGFLSLMKIKLLSWAICTCVQWYHYVCCVVWEVLQTQHYYCGHCICSNWVPSITCVSIQGTECW